MAEKKVGHVYQIVYDLGNGRQFQVNGNYAEGASAEDMYQEAAKLLDVADRIRARCEIDLLKAELDTRKKYLVRAKEDLKRIQEKGRLTPADENQIKSLRVNVEKVAEDVAEGEKNLLAAVARVNGTNPNVIHGNKTVN